MKYSKDLIKFCQFVLKNQNKILSIIKSKENKKTIERIELETKFLNSSYPLRARIHSVLNDIHKIPKCKVCGNDVKFSKNEWMFNVYCSRSCLGRSEDIIKKSKESYKKVDWKKVTKKIKDTNIDRYGVESPHQSEEIQNKIKTTKKLTTNEFIKKAESVHGNNYIYEKVYYTNSHTKVIITCPIHGDFEQTPNNHLNKRGCSVCGGKEEVTTNEFIKKAESVHGNKYDYSKVEYCGTHTKVIITCPIHGDFEQTPNNHLHKRGCYKCGKLKLSKTQSMGKEDFCKKADSVHENKYDYTNVKYLNAKTKVIITCPIHGDFEQLADNHLRGTGCPTCSMGGGSSNAEKEIVDFIKSHYNGTVLENDRTIIKPLELDIVLLDLKIAIEYCGLYWHSHIYKDKNYHLDKLNACNAEGYRLITIFEDEWVHNKYIYKSKLLNIMGIQNSKSVYAKKTQIVEIDKNEREQFLNQYHIQGDGSGSVTYGLKYNNELVSVMTFKRRSGGIYELNRFASSCNVVGGFSKLLSHFKKNNEWEEIISFADRRWSEGNVYLKSGFEIDGFLRPDYRYIIGNERKHKFGFRHVHLAKTLDNYDPTLTEFQNTENHGIYRIYDCGLLKFSISNKKV